MEFMIGNQAPNLPPKALADLFGRMVWTLADNGKELLKIRAQWLSGDDDQRVEIALLMEVIFPYADKATAIREFSRITDTWPRLRPLCERWQAQWSSRADV